MTNLRAVWLVASQEFRERVRARSFLIISALIVLMSAGGVVAADVLPSLIEKGPKRVGVVQTAGAGLAQDVETSAGALGVKVKVREFADRSSGEAALRGGDVDVLVASESQIEYDSAENATLTAVVNRAIYLRSLPSILDRLNLTYDSARALIEPTGASVALLEPGAANKADDEERRAVAWVATAILFMALVLYGQALLAGVVEEKTSRVVEVLLGTLRPEQLLSGKVLGIVSAVMLQLLAALAASGVALVVVGAAELPSGALDVALISCAFFVLGLLSYSFAYAAVGATVSRQSEADSAQMPITLALAVPYFLALSVIPDEPDGPLARALSLFPPSAPLVMPTRIACGHPLPVEIVGAALLMIPWLLAVIWIGARLYAGAILHSGPRAAFWASWRSTVMMRH